MQRGERLGARPAIGLAVRTRAKQTYPQVIRRRSAWAVCRHVRISPTPIKSFLPCDVTYTILEPRPSASLSHVGQRSRVKFARAEGLGTRLRQLATCKNERVPKSR